MSSPVSLPDLYFDSFSYPVAPIVQALGVLIHKMSDRTLSAISVQWLEVVYEMATLFFLFAKF